MSGIELQRDPTVRGHSTPAIFISAFPDDRIRAQSLIGSLGKPFDEQALL
jgi:FixJ family two-component response regulator